MVDSSNLVGYIQAVVDATLGSGIEAQLTAFREGFSEVSGEGTPVGGAAATGQRGRWAAAQCGGGAWVYLYTLHGLRTMCMCEAG